LKNIRIIPRLDIKGPNLVKGVHLEGLRVLGNPSSFAKYYYDNGADEIIYQDTVASLYERNSLDNIISQTAKEIFIPLTVGGGLRSIEDIERVLRSGADKVSINTAAVSNPDFIDKASLRFGSSTIVIALECLKKADGEFYLFTDNGREETNIEASEWAKEIELRGAGEIFLTSIDKEGTGKGFDIELTKLISDSVKIPVIAHGGCSNTNHIPEVITSGKADAISLASMLHYHAIDNLTSDDKFSEGNIEFLKSKKNFKNFEEISLKDIKQALFDKGISVRNNL
tara:strand:+ start:15798 stop:16649 length:852 start_codon:yes stop_codon:yes gene_type:complete